MLIFRLRNFICGYGGSRAHQPAETSVLQLQRIMDCARLDVTPAGEKSAIAATAEPEAPCRLRQQAR